MPFDRPAKFNKRTTEHLIDATMRVEAMPYPSRQPVYAPRPLVFGIIDAVTTSTITAMNGNSYGQGYAQPTVDQFNANSNTYTRINDPNFSNSVLVLSTSTTSGGVPTNTNIGIFWRNGRFGLAFVDCGNQ